MYCWRSMSRLQREYVLGLRKLAKRPWHSPPHQVAGGNTIYHITAAIYEHHPIIGHTPERLAAFEQNLLTAVTAQGEKVFVWCVLPNHYHLLLDAPDVMATLDGIGRLHGRTSREWNLEERKVGRKCWHRAADRSMRNDRHFRVTLNYVLNNAVHHGYVKQWREWPYSNATVYLDAIGREIALRNWYDYPVLDYGKGWDNPEA